MSINLIPSPLAVEQAGAAWPQVGQTIRDDLARNVVDLGDFLFHVVRTAESGDYFCWPDEDAGGVFVDAAVWDELPELTDGPLKGKRPMMPRPASIKKESR